MFKKVVWWEGFKNFLVLGSLDKRGIAMDSWMFNVDEKKKYERFVFENSMSTIGLGNAPASLGTRSLCRSLWC